MKDHQEDTDKELQSLLGSHKTRIRIVGTGGGGNNTISRLLEVGVKGVETIAINTDAQDLLYTKADQKVLIGRSITHGLGAGSDPKIGEESARESTEDIKNVLTESDMIFITCGLGGGTGTGSAPVIAEIAKETGALTIAIVTLPFSEEGIVRWDNARKGLDRLYKIVDTVIVVQNDRLLEMVPDMPLHTAFKVADEILVNAVKGITELVTEKGLINLDFADVRTIMQNGGMAMIGLGESDSEDSAREAAEKALQNPLLDVDITGAKSALINITGGTNMSLKAAKTVMQIVAKRLDPSARIIWGARVDESLNNTLRVMLIVTSLRSTKHTAAEIDMVLNKNELTNTEAQKEETKSEETPSVPSNAVEPEFDFAESQTVVDKTPTNSEKTTTFDTKKLKARKKASRVFSEIFIDESKADLTVLEEAIKGLSIGNRAGNEKSLREIKNACTSLNNAAELFGFDHIIEIVSIILNITQKALNGEFELSQNFLEHFSKVPAILKGLIADEEDIEPMAEEVLNKFTDILSLLDSNKNNKSSNKKSELSPEDLKISGFEVKAAQITPNNQIEEKQPNFSNVDEAVKFIDKLL